MVKLRDDLTEEELDVFAYYQDEDVKCAVAKHPVTRLKTLLTLCYHSLRVAQCVEQNPMFLLYLESNETEAILVLQWLAHKSDSLERVEAFSRMPWPEVRRGAAMNRNASSELLARMSQDLDPLVRSRVAGHVNTSVEVLSSLAKDEDDDVREQVAENENTRSSTLKSMSEDSTEFVLRALSSNPKSPASLLEILSKSIVDEARAGVAGHQNASRAILSNLAKDKIANVRLHVAQNDKTDKATLLKLCKDSDRSVQATAKNFFQHKYGSRESNPVDFIPENSSEDELVQMILVGDVDKARAASNHPNATTKVWECVILSFEELAVDVWVNPVFQLMVASQEEESLRILTRIVYATNDEELLVEWSKNNSLRHAVAANKNISPELAKELLADPDQSVRLSLSINMSTPTEVLEVLLNDPVPLVAESARETFNEHAFNEAASVGFKPFPEPQEGDQDTPATPARQERRSNPTMSADEAVAFMKREVTPVSVPDVPEGATEDDLYRLAKSGDRGKMCAAAAHPNATILIWEYLVRNNAYEVGESVWKNPLFQLLVAAQDPSLNYLLTEIAMRSRSEIVVREMAHLPPSIRKYVALNDAVPEDLAEQLAIDENVEVRQYLAENKSAPKHLVEQLLQDPVQLVRGSARSTLDHLQMIDDLEEKYR